MLPRRTLSEEFPSRCECSFYGLDYYELLPRFSVVFNIHSAKSKDTVDKVQMFKVAGVGACLMTDTGHNMRDLFEEDIEVLAYRSTDEAIEKERYLIDCPEKVREIATTG